MGRRLLWSAGCTVGTDATMRVSIVIPTLNEEGYVGSLLSDITGQTRNADEVIVVDGRSQDGTTSVVERFPGVDLLICAPPLANQRNLDVACPLYMPYRSTLLIKSIHVYVNVAFFALQKVLPSGAGHCIAIRREHFQQSRGFDPSLKVGEDVALVRKLSKGHRFGIVAKQLFVSDRRYKEEGVPRMLTKILLLSIIFTLGKFGWANQIEHEFGSHTR